MNPTIKEALRTMGRVGARAAARAVTEVVASVADDAEDLVEMGVEAAQEFIEDVRGRVKQARTRLPTEPEMKNRQRRRER